MEHLATFRPVSENQEFCSEVSPLKTPWFLRAKLRSKMGDAQLEMAISAQSYASQARCRYEAL
jgi:hypothetical protein